jgi:hypothetical protein
MPDLDATTVILWMCILLAAGGLLGLVALLWWHNRRWRAQTRRWQHDSRVHQRVQELLNQEYENLLTPEARQRREAQRRHLAELRAQAEAELAAEDAQRRRR